MVKPASIIQSNMIIECSIADLAEYHKQGMMFIKYSLILFPSNKLDVELIDGVCFLRSEWEEHSHWISIIRKLYDFSNVKFWAPPFFFHQTMSWTRLENQINEDNQSDSIYTVYNFDTLSSSIYNLLSGMPPNKSGPFRLKLTLLIKR